MSKINNDNMIVRRCRDDTDSSVQYNHQQQQQQCNAETTVHTKRSTTDRRRRTQKVRYNGACGYYICYSIFIAIVGLMTLAMLLLLHLARCVVVVSDKSIYDCFINLKLGNTQRHASTH